MSQYTQILRKGIYNQSKLGPAFWESNSRFYVISTHGDRFSISFEQRFENREVVQDYLRLR